MDWVHWLEWVKNFCKEKEIGLVIIDTISEFWSVNDENKAPEVTQALMPLNYLTEDDIAVLLVHHFRKSGGTQGTAARGSGALASKVDILVDFTRYEDSEQTTKRRLSCLSRFEETPRELVIDYINGDYIVLGNSAEVREKEKLAELLATFKAYPNGFTVKEVWENWDSFNQGKKPSKRTIQRYIARLIDAKQIEKVEDKEINGKLVPFYSVIHLRQGDEKNSENSMSQENEAVEVKKESQLDIDSTFDTSSERIDNDKNVADEKKNNKPITTIEISVSDLDNKQLIERISGKQKPAVYFGQEAIDKLITLGVLKLGQKTCQNPYKTSEEKLWVNNGNGGGDWVDAARIKCERFLFWQVGNKLPQCSLCNPWNEKYDESEVTAWYQTKERNTDGSQPHPFTIAEKYYEDTKNNLQGDKSV